MPTVQPTFAVSLTDAAVARVITTAVRRATDLTAQVTDRTEPDVVNVICGDARRFLDFAAVLSAWLSETRPAPLVLIGCPIQDIECEFDRPTPVARFPLYTEIGVDLIPCIAAGLVD